jgi:hypothetical protein
VITYIFLCASQRKVDRRSEDDRREFSYTVYIPERRNGTDRRKGKNEKSSFDLQCVLNTKRSKF